MERLNHSVMHSMLLQTLRVENLSMIGFARRIKFTKQHYVVCVIVPFYVILCSLQMFLPNLSSNSDVS